MCLRQACQRGNVLYAWQLTENSLAVPVVLLFADIAWHRDVVVICIVPIHTGVDAHTAQGTADSVQLLGRSVSRKHRLHVLADKFVVVEKVVHDGFEIIVCLKKVQCLVVIVAVVCLTEPWWQHR